MQIQNSEGMYSGEDLIFSESDQSFEISPQTFSTSESYPFQPSKIVHARCACGNLHPLISIPQGASNKGLEVKISSMSQEVAEKEKLISSMKEKFKNQGEHLKQKHTEDLVNYQHKIASLNRTITDTNGKLQQLKSFSEQDKRNIDDQQEKINELNTMYQRILVERKQFQNTIRAWESNHRTLELENKRLFDQVHENKLKHKSELQKLVHEQKDVVTSARQNVEDSQIFQKLKKNNQRLIHRNKELEKKFENIIRMQNREIQSLMTAVRGKGAVGKTSRVFYASNIKYGKNYKITELSSDKLWGELRRTIIELKERNVQLAKQIMEVTGDKNNEAERWQLKYEGVAAKLRDKDERIKRLRAANEEEINKNVTLIKNIEKNERQKMRYEKKINKMEKDFNEFLDLTHSIQNVEKTRRGGASSLMTSALKKSKISKRGGGARKGRRTRKVSK